MSIPQRAPQYAISIAFKDADLELIDQAEVQVNEKTEKKYTRREVYLAGCESIINRHTGQ